MNNQQPWQLKKSESWEPFWSYQLDNSASPSHLPQKWAKLAKSAVLFSGYLRILIFSIAMGAEYLSYVKSIATFALTFFWYIKDYFFHVSLWQRLNYYTPKMGGIGSNEFHIK